MQNSEMQNDLRGEFVLVERTDLKLLTGWSILAGFGLALGLEELLDRF